MTGPRQFDFVAMGGGIAGMVAALSLAETGRSVAVLERKSETDYANATRMSGGVFHCCLRDARTDRDELARAITAATRETSQPERVGAIADNALRAVRWLQSRGVNFMRSSPYPHHAFVLAPPNVSRRGLDWSGRGGDVLLRNLEARLNACGGTIVRGFEARDLLVADGRCVGVNGIEGGQPVEVMADRVLIADGGFQSDPDLVRQAISPRPEQLLQRNGQSGFGFGLRMAQAIGARISTLQGFYGHLQSRDALNSPQLWPYPWWDDVAVRGIVVDGHGSRFCDETNGGIYIANRVAALNEPASAFVVFDQAIWNAAGRRGQIAANPNFVRAGATIHWDDDIDALASKAGLDVGNLRQSIADHNSAAEGNVSGNMRRPIMAPPYFAAPICAGITYTMGGIVTDGMGRVVDGDDRPIPGLFAAGATTGGLEGGESVGYVGGLIKSLTMALLASEAIMADS